MFNGKIVCVCLLMLLTCPLMAQMDREEINGTVSDSSGAVVQNAKIEAVCTSNGLRREATTDVHGIYQIPSLPIGPYKVTITKEGFKPVEVQNVELAIGEPRTIDAKLVVGAISETVQVTAAV